MGERFADPCFGSRRDHVIPVRATLEGAPLVEANRRQNPGLGF